MTSFEEWLENKIKFTVAMFGILGITWVGYQLYKWMTRKK